VEKQIYELLYSFSTASVPALARLLQTKDVNAKRNALLALSVIGGGWYFARREASRIDISEALAALVDALGDSDSTVRAWAALNIGDVGAVAATYVPQLEALLNEPDERVRNDACSALKGVGPAARQALPALRRALADPSNDVRRFAQIAISAIDIYSSPLASDSERASE
jgi:HEAT repeat protein